ncbi:MAG TPA: hypothetical protein PKA60_01165 [Candidatus Paceibacterota bacterium]|nr:hypothetical protein [Candidatus Paceibacterota bacterium]
MESAFKIFDMDIDNIEKINQKLIPKASSLNTNLVVDTSIKPGSIERLERRKNIVGLCMIWEDLFSELKKKFPDVAKRHMRCKYINDTLNQEIRVTRNHVVHNNCTAHKVGEICPRDDCKTYLFKYFNTNTEIDINPKKVADFIDVIKESREKVEEYIKILI